MNFESRQSQIMNYPLMISLKQVRWLSYRSGSSLEWDKNGECKIYHCKSGERIVKNFSWLAILLVTSNSTLLALELTTPFFGWWHGMSLIAGIGSSVLFGAGLHVYSQKFVHEIFLKKDGKTIWVDYLNAFFRPKS